LIIFAFIAWKRDGAVAVGFSMTPLTLDGQRLAGFRAGWYGCLHRWADTLFELSDAVLCAPGPVTSLPRLSLEPVMGRGHGSGYAALARGLVGGQELAGVAGQVRAGQLAAGVRGRCHDLAPV